MAKNKVNVYDIVLKVAAIFTAVMSFIALAFKFASETVTATAAGKTVEMGHKAFSLSDWFDSFATLERVDGIGCWKVAKVFMIIALVLIAIVAIVAVVKFFFSNKIVDIALAVVSGLAILAIVVMAIALIAGMNKIGSALSVGVDVSFAPHAGSICLILFGLLNGVAGLLLACEKKFK